MSIRTFIFCDICNTRGIRIIEERRSAPASRPNMGRRLSDGRSWFGGTLAEARAAGWCTDAQDRHVCPRCFSHGLHLEKGPAPASP